MPELKKLYTLTITPQQFIDACDDVELQELLLLLDKKLEQQAFKTHMENLVAQKAHRHQLGQSIEPEED